MAFLSGAILPNDNSLPIRPEKVRACNYLVWLGFSIGLTNKNAESLQPNVVSRPESANLT